MKRTAVALTLIMALLCSTVASIGIISSTKANGIPYLPENLPMEQAYIRSNGDVDPSTLPIQRSGNIYVLKDNILNYSISIEKDNVELKGNGFLLEIPAHSGKEHDESQNNTYPLVKIQKKCNITIENINFGKSSTGISIEDSSNITMLKNVLNDEVTSIWIARSDQCTIIGNRIIENHWGIWIIDSKSIAIAFNNISQNIQGLFFHHLTYSNVFRNDVRGNINGIDFDDTNSDNRIFENNFIDNQESDCNGLSIDDSLYGNYWSKSDELTSALDQSPLSSPVSTTLDLSLFSSSISKSDLVPFPTVPVAFASGVSAIAISAGLLIYFKKRKH
jgi:parallel beta-helix repeat protein